MPCSDGCLHIRRSGFFQQYDAIVAFGGLLCTIFSGGAFSNLRRSRLDDSDLSSVATEPRASPAILFTFSAHVEDKLTGILQFDLIFPLEAASFFKCFFHAFQLFKRDI